MLHGTGTFELEPPNADEMRSRLERITSAGYPFLVAHDGSRVSGYAYAYAYRDRPAYRFTVEDSVYVAADAQGRGTARALLDALIAESERRGFRQMIAVIGDSANVGSIRLHARAGFTEVGVLRDTGWKHGRWLDVVLMQRALGDGSGSPII